MTIWEHWNDQKPALRAQLQNAPAMVDVVYGVRHALLQTEQNALAEMADDVLRQQAGVLFGTLKTAVGLLEANIAAQVWVPQKQADKPKHRGRTLRLLTLMPCLLLCAYGYWEQMWLVVAVAAIGLALGIAALFVRPIDMPMQDEMRITLKPDIDRLFALLDGQLRSIDRYLNDFAYLNDQLRGGSQGADATALARAADLMEALYECDEQEREAAEQAAGRLLSGLGLEAVRYAPESSRLFNILPSKTHTRTLSPAILSARDHVLLRRGTAAVCEKAEQPKELA